jgi:Chromo (CHRromatin Organisation MOdifier) domain
MLPEVEVERIVGQKYRKASNGRRIILYRTRFIGYGPEEDEWKTRAQLKNAPEILRAWESLNQRRN